MTCPSCLASGLLRSGTQPKPPLLPLPPRLACHAAPPPEPLSTCAGSFKVALHKDVALTHDEAVAFCKAEYGAGATLPSAAPDIMAAAQSLVQQGQVSADAAVGGRSCRESAAARGAAPSGCCLLDCPWY